MVALSGYKMLEVITPYPEGSGGQILNLNFQTIADHLENGILIDGIKGFNSFY